jgi:hypothetical protein
MRNADIILIGKYEEKRLLGRPRRSWEDNIRMNLGEIGWIHMSEDRNQWRIVMKTVMNLRVP